MSVDSDPQGVPPLPRQSGPAPGSAQKASGEPAVEFTAADDVTFTIEAGAFAALTGASGSGKSTMLHMIGAIERPDSGTIISNGTDVTALRGSALAYYRRTVGFVFQRYKPAARPRRARQRDLPAADEPDDDVEPARARHHFFAR
jgi:ABC-type glutathione transport system ATPase component